MLSFFIRFLTQFSVVRYGSEKSHREIRFAKIRVEIGYVVGEDRTPGYGWIQVEPGEEYISVSALLRIAKSLRIRIGQLFAEL
jgi:hypothetical protein